ncbi:uncharacterized protein N7483_012183 [Penicillium malachiteum]|uniref:uncharacterized protein n=1 Tax=Penicillium malachiteum TaxID=1324776 RepID=UPI002547B850|nr:uncharacterized protein N7483_012183 [Penicillium malachiteum]KAJ5715002.1 hypothetical protein N7483_012183 [Penicillium malachiteum]
MRLQRSISTSTKIHNPTMLSRSIRFPRSQSQFQPFFRAKSNQVRFNSGASKQSTSTSKESGSISARLKKLSREYGWAALGVYLTLSAMDFPICFAMVRLLGVERIGHFEHAVVESVKGVFPSLFPKKETQTEEGEVGAIVEAEKSSLEEASIWTQLALAYAIHKSVFIFVRVPLTAAVTPKVVQTLRRWGWDIGKRKPKTP